MSKCKGMLTFLELVWFPYSNVILENKTNVVTQRAIKQKGGHNPLSFQPISPKVKS